MSKYKAIIDKLFETNKSFNKDDFLEFISDLTWKYPDNIISHPANVDSEWNKYFREDISIFEDSSWEKIAILIYKMPSASKVEKARSHQRNLISNYLKNEWVYEDIDNVLVAFYSDNNPDWRLSFIKQEFKLSDTELDAKWRKKIVNELTPAKRFSFLVDSNSKNITVKQRLNTLFDSEISISDIEKAFSVEKVSKEFFDKYVKLYEKLTNAFKEDNVFLKIESESNHWDEHFRDNFVKKLLWQIVFLYFLQKKGWLWVKEGWKWWEWNQRFLQDLLTECLAWWDENKELWGKNFFNDYLEHLFYDFLNTKESDRKNPNYFKWNIPYLNWWLFEPINNYNWKWIEYVVLAWEKNNLLFKEIFDTFDEYNFTVYENDPLEQDVAVDPEMLGKVFENLLPENERKGKGAFYTPREIVHYMCKESLKNHIINKTWISEEKINWLFERKDSMYNSKKFWNKLSETERYEQFWEYIDYAWNIVECLKSIKIVDPAVGSWAFPMGLLKEIVSLRKYLQENILLEDNVSEYQIKKETLENCIYWVDLDPGAVEIAKLRFWLSLVIEEESSDSIDPLPNLDYKIMQWNSLIEDVVVWDTVIKLDLENNTKKLTKKEKKEFSKTTQWTMALFADENVRDDILKRLKFLHKVFFQEKDNNKKKTLKIEIDHIEKELIRISWEVEVNKLQAQIENIEWKYILSWAAWDEKDAKKVAELQSCISSIKAMEEKYKRDNIRSFFPWKLHFWEVFNENWGFDIVIWNPPYVNTNNISKWDKKYYKNNFVTSESHFDLYSIFYELSISFLLRKEWIISFITSNKWMTQKYWTNLRLLFLKYKLLKLIDFDTVKIFEKATVDTQITILEKTETFDEYNFLKYFFKKDEINLNLDKKEFSNISKEIIIRNNWIFKLNITENELDIYEKIKLNWFPAADKFNILYWMVVHPSDNSLKKKDFIYDNNPDNKFVRYTEWKNISKWKVNKTLFLDYTPSKHREPRKKEYFDSNKILCHRLAWRWRLKFLLDYNGIYVDNTLHLIIPNNVEENLYFYIWLFNSKLLSWVFKTFLSTNLDVYPDHLKKLPLVDANNKKPLTDLIEKIILITKSENYLEREDLQKEVKVLEKQIDDMVYKLYDLSDEEIELVEESLK